MRLGPLPKGEWGKILVELAKEFDVDYIGVARGNHVEIVLKNNKRVCTAATPRDSARTRLNLRTRLRRAAAV